MLCEKHLCDIFNFSSILHECIEEVIESYMVLPNKITVPFADDPEIQQALLYQPPMVRVFKSFGVTSYIVLLLIACMFGQRYII